MFKDKTTRNLSSFMNLLIRNVWKKKTHTTFYGIGGLFYNTTIKIVKNPNDSNHE